MQLVEDEDLDVNLAPINWTRVIGKISTFIDMDSKSKKERRESKTILKQEIEAASHLGVQACILSTPKGNYIDNYAKYVNQILQSLKDMKLLLRIPFQDDCWTKWKYFQKLCHDHSNLSVVLDITSSLPPDKSFWHRKSVFVAILNTEIFYYNSQDWIRAYGY